ncbi:MAG: MFS transporter [Anaerolineae bacterium]
MPTSPARGTTNPLVLTAAYYVTLALLGLVTAAQGPSLPTLAQHTSTTVARAGLVFVADAFGYLLGSLGGGRLYDRLPGHRLMAAMLVVMLAAAAVLPLAPALWLLLVLGFVVGLGKGAADVGCNTLLQWVHGARVGPYMNGLHFAFGLGSFIAPLLLARIIFITHEIYWVFWIIALLVVPVVVWLWFLPSPGAHVAGAGVRSASLPVLPVLVMVAAFVLYVGAELGFSNWIYSYALTLKLAGVLTAAYLTSAYWAAFTLGRLLGVWISTRLRSRTILLVDFLGCLLSVGLIALARDSAAVLWVGSIGLGLFTASIFPTLLILAGEHLQVTGTVTGLFLLGAGAGGMLLPWLIGAAFGSIGPQSMTSIIFVDLALGLAAVLLFLFTSRAAAPESTLLTPE